MRVGAIRDFYVYLAQFQGYQASLSEVLFLLLNLNYFLQSARSLYRQLRSRLPLMFLRLQTVMRQREFDFRRLHRECQLSSPAVVLSSATRNFMQLAPSFNFSLSRIIVLNLLRVQEVLVLRPFELLELLTLVDEVLLVDLYLREYLLQLAVHQESQARAKHRVGLQNPHKVAF